jgi:hypothetical protein
MSAPSPRPLPGWLTGIAGLVGFVLCFGLAVTIKTMSFYWATARVPGLGVWVHTPYVAPGDKLVIEVGVFGGDRAALGNVRISGAGIEIERVGKGPDWGAVITTRTGDVGEAYQVLEATIPATAAPHQTSLRVETSAVVAESSGGSFDNKGQSRIVDVPLTIHTPGGRTISKIVAALGALALLAIMTVAVARLFWPFKRLLARVDAGGRQSAGVWGPLAIGLSIVFVGAGIFYFAAPLRHATGLVGDGYTFVTTMVWLVVPFAMGLRFRGSEPRELSTAAMKPIKGEILEASPGYRAPAKADRPRKASAAALAKVLVSVEGVRVKQQGQVLRAERRKPKGRVVLELGSERTGARTMVFRYDDPELAVQAAHALHKKIGPFEIEIERVPVVVDGTRTAEELATAWRGAWASIVMGDLSRMTETLSNLRAQLDRQREQREE